MSMTAQEIIESRGKMISSKFVIAQKSGNSYSTVDEISDEDISEIRYYFDGALYSSVMRCLEVKLIGNCTEKVKKDFLLKDLILTVTSPDGDEDVKINYGSYYVAEAPEYDASQNLTSIIAYDELYLSMQSYNLKLNWTNGITLKEYLIAILNELGIEYDSDSLKNMANSDVIITSDKFIENDETESAYTYRDVLDEIAKASGTSFAFKNSYGGNDSSKLYCIRPTESGIVLNGSNFRSVTIGDKYGPVKGVVISREPQEDNIYYPTALSDSETAIKISNVEIMEDSDDDTYRENFIEGIYGNVKDTEYYLYDLDSYGIAILNFGDIFTLSVCDRENGEVSTEEKSYKTIFMRTDMTIGDGLSEKSKLEAPQTTSTDYESASTTDKTLKKTMLKVDKQNQQIMALIEDPENGLQAQIKATAEKLESTYSSVETIKSAGYITEKECSSLITASADTISLKVEENIKIGTRNILLDSACFGSFTPDTQWSNSIECGDICNSSTPSGESKTFEWTINDNAEQGGIMFKQKAILGQNENEIDKVKGGTTYTLSLKAKAVDEDFSLLGKSLLYTGKGVSYDDSRSSFDEDGNIALSTLKWRKVVVVFTIGENFTDSSGAFCIRFLAEKGTDGKNTKKLCISSLKLEEGNIATDWTPAVDDIEQSVQAQIDMCVKTDENNNLVSQINISGNQLTINTDNFTLDGSGKITCSGATITDSTITCGDDNYHITISQGSISNYFFESDGNGGVTSVQVGSIGTALSIGNEKMDYYESIVGITGVQISVNSGCGLLGIAEDSVVARCTDFSINHEIDNSSKNIKILTIKAQKEWSYSSYNADLREMISVNSALVISANSGNNGLYLQGKQVVICGDLVLTDNMIFKSAIGVSSSNSWVYVVADKKTGAIGYASA